MTKNGNDSNKKISGLTDAEKVSQFKIVTIILLVLLILTSSVLFYNMGEVKKYKAIATGNYVTMEECNAMNTPSWVQTNQLVDTGTLNGLG